MSSNVTVIVNVAGNVAGNVAPRKTTNEIETEIEDAYQTMMRQRADDDLAMRGGADASSSGGSLGFAPVGAEMAGGLLGDGPNPSHLGPGERQRYETMLRMNGWSSETDLRRRWQHDHHLPIQKTGTKAHEELGSSYGNRFY